MKHTMLLGLALTLVATIGCSKRDTRYSSAGGASYDEVYSDTSSYSEPLPDMAGPVEVTEPVPAFDEPAPAPAGATGAGGQSYTIQKGDTLWSLAVKFYGDGQQWRQIDDANPSISPQRLPVGQEIVIP